MDTNIYGFCWYTLNTNGNVQRTILFYVLCAYLGETTNKISMKIETYKNKWVHSTLLHTRATQSLIEVSQYWYNYIPYSWINTSYHRPHKLYYTMSFCQFLFYHSVDTIYIFFLEKYTFCLYLKRSVCLPSWLLLVFSCFSLDLPLSRTEFVI